jgi:hypothetical protein
MRPRRRTSLKLAAVAVIPIGAAATLLNGALAGEPSLAGYDATAVCVGSRATKECFRMQQLGRIMTLSFWKETSETEHFNCLASYPGPDILPLSYCLNGYAKKRHPE